MRLDSRTERELYKRYPSTRFRRYRRWRPGWSPLGPRFLRFRYVEMMADFLRAQCAHVRQTWQKDGVELACSSGEAYFCSYRDLAWQVTGHEGTALAKRVEDFIAPPSADPQSEVALARAKEEKESRLIEAILALDASFPQELAREESRRGTLRASLFIPFLYALLIVGLALGHYPGKQLFGKGELFLAAGVALVPAIGLAREKFQELDKAKLYARRVTSFYYDNHVDFLRLHPVVAFDDRRRAFRQVSCRLGGGVGWHCGCANYF